mgnify:CR=1 FL=1
MPQDVQEPVAILGCGLIGTSWAALFLHHGIDVRAWDPSSEARKAISEKVKAPMAQLADMGPPAVTLGNLSVFTDMSAALDGVLFAQENAPEEIELKHEIYHNFELFAGPEALIASSASGLSWSSLSANMSEPERLLTAHPFNPPHLVPLVEMYSPLDVVLERAERLYFQIGRVPVRMKREATGHIANRLASALWREAVNIVVEGIADVEAVDQALVNGPGLRWAVAGAHMTYHLGGGEGGMTQYLKHLGPSQESRWKDLGTPALTPEVCAILIAGVEAEAKGKSIKELEQARDAGLMRLLAARDGKG